MKKVQEAPYMYLFLRHLIQQVVADIHVHEFGYICMPAKEK